MASDQPGDDGGARAPRSNLAGDLLFSAVVLGLLGVLVLRVVPGLLDGRLVETDSYMRLVRVRRLLETWAWFDGTVPRSNAPFGETLHWTRPVDVLLLVGTGILRSVLGTGRALHVAGVLISPVLLVGVCFATAHAVRPLAGGRLRYHAMIAVLAQVGVMGYALPGRADHHALILLAFVAAVGSALAWLVDPGGRRGFATGAWAGLGLWVSTEFLVAVAVLLTGAGVAWVVRGGEVASRAREMSIALLATAAAAVVLEHAPSELLLVEYDRVSVVHLAVLGLVTLFWVAVTFPVVEPLGRGGRLGAGAVGAALVAGGTFLTFPRFFGGPMVDVDPELKRSWLPYLTEYQPFLVPHDLADWGRILAYLGASLLAAGVTAWALRASGERERRGGWIMLAVGLVVFVPLGIRWVRFVTYAELLGVIGSMAFLASLLRGLDRRAAATRVALVRGGVAAAVIAGPLLTGAAVMAAGGESGARVRAAGATQTEACSVERMVSVLADPSGLGSRPRVVLAHVDLGPVILYRTPHSVVATPYHRNAAGILDARRFFEATDTEVARDIAEARGAEVVVACGVQVPPAPVGEQRLVVRLVNGTAPAWLVPVNDALDLGLFLVRVPGEP